MLTRLRSLEQLMPFATAGELLMQKRQSVVAIAPGATAIAALREMEEKDIGFLPVLEGGKLVGVVAERDIARGVTERVAGVLSVRDLTGSLIERHERLLRKLNEERVTLLFPYPSSY